MILNEAYECTGYLLFRLAFFAFYSSARRKFYSFTIYRCKLTSCLTVVMNADYGLCIDFIWYVADYWTNSSLVSFLVLPLFGLKLFLFSSISSPD